jgi:hypothetical protein
MTVYTSDMERTNIYLDDDTRAAAQYIRDQLAMASDSAAIRYAVREIAMGRGWKPGGDPPKPSRQRRHAKQTGAESVA